jgi:ApeA N-terminal domain 1
LKARLEIRGHQDVSGGTQRRVLLDDLITDRKATINAIYDNRNYLTHYDATLKGRSATGARLLFMVEVLKLLLQACFLRELGLPDTTIKEFASRSRTVRVLRTGVQNSKSLVSAS